MSTTETMDLIADDDIDTEMLQAQINMSMSFAEDLVSSWIQPAHKANLSNSAVDAQKLLDEQLRRPPRCVIVWMTVMVSTIDIMSLSRLGVGAPIPESSTTARDAARLKHLIGKGVKRVPEDDTTLKTEHSEDEERRGGTVRKKTKLDPFAVRSKTKANISGNSVTQSTHKPSSSHQQADSGDSKTGGDDLGQGRSGPSISASLEASKPNLSAKKREKKSRKRSATGSERSMSFQELAIPHSQSITTPDRSGNQSLSVNSPPLGSELSSVSFSTSGPFSIAALQTGESLFCCFNAWT
jgi:hypothetical protein